MDTITIHFSLTKEDFLMFQLYAASKSERIKKKRLMNWLALPGLYLLLLGYAAIRGPLFAVWILSVVILAWVVSYPFYSRNKYRKHYSDFIQENYKNRIGITGSVSVNEEYVSLQDTCSESRFKITEVKQIVEIKNYYFIENSQNMTIIVPKKTINSEQFIKKIESILNIQHIEELDWKWK